MAKSPVTSQRNSNIDLLRGYLILLVIVGHIVVGSVHDNLVRYAIYAFHMPLFIGLSGYLINVEKLLNSGFLTVFSRYWWRVILPFLLAFCFFTGVLIWHAVDEGRMTQSLLFSYVHTPYYHLWYIPTLVIWVFLFWFLVRIQSTQICLILFAALTVLWATVPTTQMWPLLAILLSKKVVYFFSFFLFGAWLRTNNGRGLIRLVTSFKALPAALVLLCASVYLMNIGPDKSLFKGLAWWLMNVALIGICVAWVMRGKPPKLSGSINLKRILISMGRISLPVYLWHFVPMFLLKGWGVHQSSLAIYYAVSTISSIAIVFILIKLENKSALLNKCVYGT